MIIRDTNIISELLRPTPEPRVEAWLAAQDSAGIYLTAITEAELHYGVAIMADGKRRDGLAEAIDGLLRDDRGRLRRSFCETAFALAIRETLRSSGLHLPSSSRHAGF